MWCVEILVVSPYWIDNFDVFYFPLLTKGRKYFCFMCGLMLARVNWLLDFGGVCIAGIKIMQPVV
jgi:hypothetical protein